MPALEAIAARPAIPLTPARIERAEAELLELPQAECPLRHIFAPGLVVREVTMPAGALVIGHTHREADLNIMLTGRLTLLQQDGTLKELRAPQTFIGAPGRKIAYIHETVIWQNIWPMTVKSGKRESGKAGNQIEKAESGKAETEWMTLPNDVEAIEDHYLDRSPTWLADRAQRLALDRLARQPDRESFEAFLNFHELPAEDVRRISECVSDQVPLWNGEWKFMIGDSAIEGKGVLATANIAAGETIAPMRISGMRTPPGRYCNHAKDPNAEVRPGVGTVDLVLVARRDIRGCQGGQPGEEITVDYESVLAVNNALAVSRSKMKGLL